MSMFDNDRMEDSPVAGIGRRDVLRYGAGALSLSALAPSVAIFGKMPIRPAFAEIGHGKLRGEAAGGVKVFKGIPYGASTGGTNRFRSPQPAAKWAGVRDATKFGDTAPQVYNSESGPESGMGEDCLSVNVWAPERPKSSAKLPVMVWLHGGGYAAGSANIPLYDGSNIARRNEVVVVGVNSRLNIFGFSFFESANERFAASGNTGLLDIVQALQWIRDNIEAFGGDSGNVTIFGESGGGCKINLLLGMPAARGLFHKAIVQSGRLFDLRRPELALRMADKAYARLDIKPGDIAALQRVPMKVLVDLVKPIAMEASSPLGSMIAHGPTLDGVVFKQQPWAAGAPEHTRNIPMLVGTVLDEQVGWIAGQETLNSPYPNDESIGEAAIKGMRFTSSATGGAVPLNVMLEIIAASRKELPDLSQAERLVRVSSDGSYRSAAIHQSELRVQCGGAAIYSYELRWRSPQSYPGMWAPHGTDLGVVFGHKTYDGNPMAAIGKEALYDAMQGRVMDAWATFARSGNPSTPDLRWPAYDLSARPTMIFDGVSKVENDPRPLLRQATEQMYKSGFATSFDGAAPS